MSRAVFWIAAALGPYAATAFTFWDMDPSHWDMLPRCLVAIATAWLLVVCHLSEKGKT